MEAVLTRQSRIAPRTAVAKPVSAAIAIGSRWSVRGRGPDHRHRRSNRFAVGPADPGLAERAQDPARVGRGRRYGGDLRGAAGGRRARGRVVALRVLHPRSDPADDQREHRRGDALAVLRVGPVVLRARAPFRRALAAPVLSHRWVWRADCSPSSSTRACSRSKTASAASPSTSSGGPRSVHSGSHRSACSSRARSASATTRSATC